MGFFLYSNFPQWYYGERAIYLSKKSSLNQIRQGLTKFWGEREPMKFHEQISENIVA